MAEKDIIRVDTENQRTAGTTHTDVAEFLRDIPTNHDEIIAWLESLGPIYKPLLPELRRVLDERHADYTDQADHHENLGAGLHASADRWDAHEDAAANQIRSSLEQ